MPSPGGRRRQGGRSAPICLFYEPLPKWWIKPRLPTLVDKPPVGRQWVQEIKWDGYRVSAYVADGKVTIRTRNGHDWPVRFSAIARAAAALKVRLALIDGEAVILDDRGQSSFAELQADLDRHGSDRAVLYASTCSFSTARNPRGRPLEERRLSLGGIIPKRSAMLTSEEFSTAPARTCSRSPARTSSRASCRSGSTAPTALFGREIG